MVFFIKGVYSLYLINYCEGYSSSI